MSNRLRKGEVLMTQSARDALDEDIRKLSAEVKTLRSYIKQLGEISDTCTFDILGQICDECRCGKAR